MSADRNDGVSIGDVVIGIVDISWSDRKAEGLISSLRIKPASWSCSWPLPLLDLHGRRAGPGRPTAGRAHHRHDERRDPLVVRPSITIPGAVRSLRHDRNAHHALGAVQLTRRRPTDAHAGA